MLKSKSQIRRAFVLLLILAALMLGACQAAEPLKLPENAEIDAAAAGALAVDALSAQIAERHDRYAIYYTPEEYAELFRSVSGSYSGIGVYIYPDEAGRAMVYGVMKGGPAYEAGVLPGDVFLRLNGDDLSSLTYDEVADSLLGFVAGTQLELTFLRPDDGEVVIKLKTAKVEIPTVESVMLDDEVGLIKISSFNMTTGEQFTTAYNDLAEQGMQGLILDLRDNGGGEINSALQVCNYFVPDGEPMMYITDSDGVYYYTSNRAATDLPVVILQNGHTASASEVVIGAAHDCGMATLIGETTYGKGIVQDLQQLDSGAGLRFTSAKYSTAHKNDIHGVGIVPDIVFPMPEDADNLAAYTMEPEQDTQLAKAMAVLAEKMVAKSNENQTN